mgnify:CR=1 FL=1
MKKQKQGRLLCALCLALLLIPLAGMLLAGPSDAVSNERLAAKPRLMRGGKLNPDFLSETADYFAGHFYLHKVSAINGGKTFQISNNHGHVNGWIGKKCIYGLVVEKF